MAFGRLTEASSNHSLRMLPLCKLIPALQEKSLQELDDYFIQFTHALNPTSPGVHAIFLKAREEIDLYRNKTSLLGIDKAFDGYIDIINDRNNNKGYEVGDGCYIKLTKQHMDILINIIKVYKAYSIQQFKMKELVEQIRLLEFPEAIYQKADRLYQSSASILDDKNLLIIKQFNQLLASISVDDHINQNEVLDQYVYQLSVNTHEIRRTIADHISFIEVRYEQCRQGYIDINTEIMRLNGRIIHDVDETKQEAGSWYAGIEAQLTELKKRKKAATSQSMLDAVNRDIAAFQAQFYAKKQTFITFQQALIGDRAALIGRKNEYSRHLAENKKGMVTQARLIMPFSNLPAVPQGINTNILDYKSFSDLKIKGDDYKKLYIRLRKIEMDLLSLIQDINEFLKDNLRAQSSSAKLNSLHAKWTEIITYFKSIPETRIVIDDVGLEKSVIDRINAICNISYDCVQQVRNGEGIASEIACIQADAQRYVSRHADISSQAKILLGASTRFDSMIADINRGISQKLQDRFDAAQQEKIGMVRDGQQAISRQIDEIGRFNPEFLDINDRKIEVLDQRRLAAFERNLVGLQQETQARPAAASLLPNRRPSKPGFFRRHIGFIVGATAVTGVLGLAAGAALAAGIILAPATFGLSLLPATAACIGIGVGVGIAVALGVTLTGSVMACAACGVADACCQPAQRQQQSEESLLGGGSTATVHRTVPVSEGDRAANELAELARALSELPDDGDFTLSPAAAVDAVGSHQRNRFV